MKRILFIPVKLVLEKLLNIAARIYRAIFGDWV
jgi:hypothetical protein